MKKGYCNRMHHVVPSGRGSWHAERAAKPVVAILDSGNSEVVRRKNTHWRTTSSLGLAYGWAAPRGRRSRAYDALQDLHDTLSSLFYISALHLFISSFFFIHTSLLISSLSMLHSLINSSSHMLFCVTHIGATRYMLFPESEFLVSIEG